MPKITQKDIEKISRLAQIEVSNEKEILSNQIENVINWIEKLNEVNTENVEPMITVHDQPLKLNKDLVSDENNKDDVLKNAPKQIYGYFAVPKVIE
ncbi:MAG: Asp-tRNA(Asn)/Glu-tRNA(Gln) amidotransferase subunit GatC [Proteobacteria bacterium]|nr:Asp-tRNA(Asn)/Glu-tRNA(Gln) amidotransferase subunit GatC [Pseudomonadota bacterium]NCA27782.1 Asp-tRNA(Asn)/Glu-tRNA(Gln) amidotransferase subunit GatC [Pseudomonadota bacterium]